MGLQRPTVARAPAANDPLALNAAISSFVLTRYHGQIFISARSIDEVNVQLIMEKMGGGGHLNIAGCQLVDVSVEEAIATLKATISSMTESGDLG